MAIKSDKTKIKVKIDKTPQHKRMCGRERHLTLGRLLENNTLSLSTNDIIEAILKGYSILPKIHNKNKIIQNLFVVDFLDVTNIQMHTNVIPEYIRMGIPPFASFNFISDEYSLVYRLLFKTSLPVCDEEDINKIKALLRAIVAPFGINAICPSIIDGGPLKSFLFYGDIKVDLKTALNSFHPSYKKYIINENAAKIRYPKDWFRTNKYK